jgi:hypothetical protein
VAWEERLARVVHAQSLWLQEVHAPISAYAEIDMARGSHAPEGSRARGSAWEVLPESAGAWKDRPGAWKRVDHHGGAWERVKRVGKRQILLGARGSAWITMEARGSA